MAITVRPGEILTRSGHVLSRDGQGFVTVNGVRVYAAVPFDDGTVMLFTVHNSHVWVDLAEWRRSARREGE